MRKAVYLFTTLFRPWESHLTSSLMSFPLQTYWIESKLINYKCYTKTLLFFNESFSYIPFALTIHEKILWITYESLDVVIFGNVNEISRLVCTHYVKKWITWLEDKQMKKINIYQILKLTCVMVQLNRGEKEHIDMFVPKIYHLSVQFQLYWLVLHNFKIDKFRLSYD